MTGFPEPDHDAKSATSAPRLRPRPGEPAVPRNQMGGSTPSCYNRVNSKLLLTLSAGPKGLLGAVASVRGLGGDAGVPWLPAASVDVAEYLTTLVGRAAGLATGSRGPFYPPGYVRRSEDRLSEPRSPRLDHRRNHLVRGPGRVSAEAVAQACHLRRRLDPPGDLAGRHPEHAGARVDYRLMGPDCQQASTAAGPR